MSDGNSMADVRAVGRRGETPAARAASEIVREYAFALQSIDNAHRKLRVSIARQVGFGVSELVTLVVIQERDVATPSVLAEEVGLTTGAMTTMLDRLGASGYVRRRPHPQDRRSVLVELTPEGVAVLALVSERYIGAIAPIVGTTPGLADGEVIAALNATAVALGGAV